MEASRCKKIDGILSRGYGSLSIHAMNDNEAGFIRFLVKVSEMTFHMKTFLYAI